MRRLIALIPIFFLLLSINHVFAVDIDITEFDDRLGEALGVGAFGGGLIISVFTLILFLGLIGLVSRRAPSTMMVLLLGTADLSMCIAFGWFPVWSLIIVVLLVAFMFGGKIIRLF